MIVGISLGAWWPAWTCRQKRPSMCIFVTLHPLACFHSHVKVQGLLTDVLIDLRSLKSFKAAAGMTSRDDHSTSHFWYIHDCLAGHSIIIYLVQKFIMQPHVSRSQLSSDRPKA